MADIIEIDRVSETGENIRSSAVLLTLIERNAIMTAEEIAEDTETPIEDVTSMLDALITRNLVRTYTRQGTTEIFYRECCSPGCRAGHHYTPEDFSMNM